MFEIWVDKFIKKVPLEQLAQMASCHNLKQVFFIKKGERKMLVVFLQNNAGRIFNDGKYVLKASITETLFTEVNSYKRMIIYNHFKEICSYSNDAEELINYHGTFVFPVFKFPSKILDEVASAILEKNKGAH